MKQILVLGAGKSTPHLIRYLLDQADAHDWFVTVGDIDVAVARERIEGHPRGNAIAFDVTDTELERILNEVTAEGWRFDAMQFAMRDSSKRPAMAFLTFVRQDHEGSDHEGSDHDEGGAG